MKNWKTTVAGLITGLPIVADALNSLYTAYIAGQFNGKSGFELVVGIGAIVWGAVSKDHNVTGGTKQQ